MTILAKASKTRTKSEIKLMTFIWEGRSQATIERTYRNEAREDVD